MIFREPYQVFIAIFEEQSLSRAADRLDAHQGALSKALAKVEGEIGSPCFVRTNRGLVPTKEGQDLYHQLRSQHALWSGYRERKRTTAQPQGVYRIGGHPSVLEQFAPSLAHVVEKFPLAEFEYVFRRSPEATRAVLNHELDLAFVANPTRFSELVILGLKKEPVGLYAHTPVPKKDAIVYNPELLSAHSILRKTKTRLLAVNDYAIAARLAREWGASALLPEYIAFRSGLRHLQGKPHFVAQLALVVRSDHRVNTGLLRLVQELKTHAISSIN